MIVFSFVTAVSGMNGVPPFNYTSGGNCATEWKVWLQQFEFFVKALPDTGAEIDWCALLLHYAGPKVQQVHLSLESEAPTEEIRRGPLASGYVTRYSALTKNLTDFFAPKRNPTYERCVFRKMKQLTNETIDVYAMRLREQAERCEFGDRLDEAMKDQITSCCSSKELRKKILCRRECMLDEIMTFGRIIETVEEEGKIFNEERNSAPSVPANDVNKIQHRRKFNGRWQQNRKQDEISCGRCGRTGHSTKDEKCPAKDKKCRKCGMIGHFARKCFTKKRSAENDAEITPKLKQTKTEENVQWIDNPPRTDSTDEDDQGLF